MATQKNSTWRAKVPGGLAYTEARADRLREIDPDGLLCYTGRNGNDTEKPEGYWIDCARGDRLMRVAHAFGRNFWIEPVLSIEGASEGAPVEAGTPFPIHASDLRRGSVLGELVTADRFEHADHRERGEALHLTCARCSVCERFGTEDHYAFASGVLGKTVTHFRLLTRSEIAQVDAAAKSEREPREAWEHYAAECARHGVSDAEAYLCRAAGLSERLALDEAPERAIGDARRQLQHDRQRGKLGAGRRRPGEGTHAHQQRTASA